MTDLRNATAYSGIGGIGLIIIAAAIFMFTKGMIFPAIMIILIGAISMFGFHHFIGPGLNRRRMQRETMTSEEIIRRFQIIAGKRIEAEVGGQEAAVGVQSEQLFVERAG